MRFSESTKYPALIIFSFLSSTCNRNTCFQTNYGVRTPRKTSISLSTIIALSLKEIRDKLNLTRHDTISYFYSGVNFCEKNVCGYLYLRELIFADGWKNRKNRKN